MKKIFFTLIGFFLIISTAYANVGVPMFVVIWPMYWILLIPIILIESWYSKRFLRSVPFKKIFWPITVANLFSTLIGIPIVYGLLLLIQLLVPGAGSDYLQFPEPNALQYILSVTVQAPWLMPYESYESYLFWRIPVAILFLLIPFYFASAWIESFILTKFFNVYPDRALMKKITWKANLMSYLFLFLLSLGILSYSIYEHFHPKPKPTLSEKKYDELIKHDIDQMSEIDFERISKRGKMLD